MRFKNRILCILSILLAILTTYKIKLQQNQTNLKQDTNITVTSKNEPTPKHTLIVFVHGTILPLPSPSCIFSSLNKRFEKNRKERKSWSQYYYEELRHKTFFRCKPIGDYGLEKVENVCTKKYPYTQKAAKLYENCYNFVNKNASSILHFYTFGWDGLLSQKSRITNARSLYQSLITEINNIKNKINLSDQDIEIILLGHSHGGNVLLNLAKAEDEFKKNLKINKLILLGTPVQSETSQFIDNPMFEKIYSFYSKSDMIQIADIVSTEDDISKRRFKNNLPESKLVQIELKIGNKKPLHAELWLFGQSSSLIYRPDLAIYPLPAFLFTPIIINELDQKYSQAHEIFAQIDKNKKSHCFSVEIKNKDLENPQDLINIPEEILNYNSICIDK